MATLTAQQPHPWRREDADRGGRPVDDKIRRCGSCDDEIKPKASGRGWQWANGLCPRCEMRVRRARARHAARPRLQSGCYGYSPRLGTARGIAS